MGNVQPAWHSSSKLNAELCTFHDRVAVAAEKAVVVPRETLKEYLDAIRDTLKDRKVFVFRSLEIISECWREEKPTVDEMKDDGSIQFQVVCLLEGGDALTAEKAKSNGDMYTSGSMPRFHLKQASSGGCLGRLSKSNKQIKPERELLRQTTLGYLGIISADETRKRFIEHIEASLKVVKLITEGYRLELDGSSVRLDVYRRGQVYLKVFLTLHYEINGCRYIPEPYNRTEPRMAWIISNLVDNTPRLDSSNKSQLIVLHLLRSIQKGRPELKALGSLPLTETMLTEIAMTSPEHWTMEKIGSRLLAVLTRLEVGLAAGIISPQTIIDKRQKKMNLVDAIPKETLSNSARFLKRICTSETDFYKEILEPSKSSATYKYFERMTLITQPNDLYSV